MADYVRGRPATREAPQRAHVAYAPPVTPPCLRPGRLCLSPEDAMDRERPITQFDKLTLQLTLDDLVKTGVGSVPFPPVLFGPYISGLEVTQSLQYREAATHLTDPADRGPNNSIR